MHSPLASGGETRLLDPAAVAALLREVAAYLRLERDTHRARAYERAAAVVEAIPAFERRVQEARLEELAGVGRSLAWSITELATTGTLPLLERLRAQWPAGIFELARVEGLGVRRARQLHDERGIRSVADLIAACRAGRVRAVPGFGTKTEAKLLAAAERPSLPPRAATPVLLVEARKAVVPLVEYLRSAPGVAGIEPAGELRRWCETVGSLAVAVATSDADGLREHLARHPLVADLGKTDGATIPGMMVSGLPFSVYAGSSDRFGALLAEATGSASHWHALQERAADRGIQLAKLVAPDEHVVYEALGLPWLPPEIREGTDELAAADGGAFATPLVCESDVRGAVHCHSRYSDGKATIAEMAQAAELLGLDYLTITDHSQSATYAKGLSLDRLREQWDEIDELQSGTRVRLFKGTECDILADGALDWPDAVLERLDVVIASVHQRYRQDEDQMTRRIVRAMRAPVFKIWGHALGRILLHRDPIRCRVDEVFAAIAESPAAIELNGDPHRLDLEPELVRRARAAGIRFVVSSDAHSTRGLGAASYAVHMARRARLTARDVLNCRPAEAFAEAVRPVR
jgi:DNA polymerase (family X)